MSKSFQMGDHFFSLFFPKDSENLKSLDIGLWEVGAKRPLNEVRKCDWQTHKQKHTQTYGHFDLYKRRNKIVRDDKKEFCIRGGEGHLESDLHDFCTHIFNINLPCICSMINICSLKQLQWKRNSLICNLAVITIIICFFDITFSGWNIMCKLFIYITVL